MNYHRRVPVVVLVVVVPVSSAHWTATPLAG
jgi:hypothetical protein